MFEIFDHQQVTEVTSGESRFLGFESSRIFSWIKFFEKSLIKLRKVLMDFSGLRGFKALFVYGGAENDRNKSKKVLNQYFSAFSAFSEPNFRVWYG